MFTNKGKLKNLRLGINLLSQSKTLGLLQIYLLIATDFMKSHIMKSKKRPKVNPKTIHKSDLYQVKPSTRQQTEDAHVEHIKNQLNRGFTPRWYITFHLHDWLNKYPQDSPIWNKYQGRLKNAVWTAIYGSHWQRVKTKARGIFSLEFGKERDRPHINLLIEELPIPYKKVCDLFNWRIPVLANKKTNFVWAHSADIQPYYSDSVTGYISKEMNYEYTSSINYLISDNIP